MNTKDLGALQDMRSKDPDGWEHRRPTIQDYADFRHWALGTYGQRLYSLYMRAAWNERAV